MSNEKIRGYKYMKVAQNGDFKSFFFAKIAAQSVHFFVVNLGSKRSFLILKKGRQ